MKRRLVLLVFIFLFIGLGLFGLSNFKSRQKLNVTIAGRASGVSATLYRVSVRNDDVSPENRIDKSKPVKQFTASETVTLKKGEYVLITSESTDYSSQVLSTTLGDEPQALTVDPVYTNAKLAALLNADKTALDTLIKTAFPSANNYDIGAGELSEHGDWYGTTLRPKQTLEEQQLNYVDVYRLVAHKENGVWKMVTSQPQLVVNRYDYPNIPRDVLVGLNQQ